MAMNKDDFATAIMNALNGVTQYPQAMTKFGDAIKKYIEDNCVIDYSWAATMPPPVPVPDPVVSYTAKVIFPAFVILVPSVPSAAVAMQALSVQLLTNINAGIITPNDPTFLVPPAVFLPATPIIVTPSGTSDAVQSMKLMCDQIITCLKTKINPVPLPGAHLAFTVPVPGAIMTNIS